MAASSTSVSKLDDESVNARLSEIVGWKLNAGKLHRRLQFDNFVEAFGFMTKVALLAETKNHHPDWSNVYNRVTVCLNTHDVGGISDRDFDLAAAIDGLLGE